VKIQSRPIATGEGELRVIEAQAIQQQPLQLDRNPQMPGNAETPVVDRNMRRQRTDSSAQNPDYEPPKFSAFQKRAASHNT
jgi:hypothetical protein